MIFDANNIFVVVSEPRTGSTVLTHKLELLDNVSCQGEIFHPDEIYSSAKVDSIPTREERDSDPISFLQKILEQTFIQRGQSKTIGFKLFFDHNATITSYVLDKKIPTILLERRNKLAQYSSLKIAKKTGKWNSDDVLTKEQEELNKKRGKKVRFFLLEFIIYSIRSRFRFNNLINKAKKSDTPYFYTSYEKMFDSKEWENIINFLKIETQSTEVNPTYEKQNKGSIFSRFSNPGYAYFCCKIIRFLPTLPDFLGFTPNLFQKTMNK